MIKGVRYAPLPSGGDVPLETYEQPAPSFTFADPEVDALLQRKCKLCKQFYTKATANFL